MIGKDHLLSIVERVERVTEERKALGDDLKEIFAEARGNGFDVPALKEVIKRRAKVDDPKTEERNAIVDTYMIALGMIPAIIDRAHVHVHEAPGSVRDSDAAAPKANSEMSQHAPAGGVSDEAGKNSPDGASESQHPGPHATGGLDGNVDTRSGDAGGMVREARTEATAVTDRRDGQPISPASEPPNNAADLPEGANASGLSSNHVAVPDVPAEEVDPSKVQQTSSVTHSESEPSSTGGPTQAEEGARGRSVSTRGKAERLPVPARDPHRFGSYKRTPEPEMPAFLRRGKVPDADPAVSENTYANIPRTETVQ